MNRYWAYKSSGNATHVLFVELLPEYLDSLFTFWEERSLAAIDGLREDPLYVVINRHRDLEEHVGCAVVADSNQDDSSIVVDSHCRIGNY